MALSTYEVPRDNGEPAVLLLNEQDAKRLGLKPAKQESKAAEVADKQAVPVNKAAKPANKRGRPRKEE